MARILYLTQVLPYPLNTGARVRQYYVLRHLSRRHEVTLASFVREDDRPEHVSHLKGLCAEVHTVPMRRSKVRDARAVFRGLLTRQSFVIVRDEIAAMQQLVDGLLTTGRYDVVQADQVAMAQYGLRGHGVKRVLDLHNAMYLVTERLAQSQRNPIKRAIAQRETRALAQYEAELCAKFDRVVFVTDEDRQLIEQQIDRFDVQANGARFATIPICVDPTDTREIAPVERPFRVTALGVMFWPPNAEGVAWFADEIWPRVRAAQPAAVLTVVGKNPPDFLARLDETNNIEVTGFVPDVKRILAETAAFIVPLRAGGGMRVKILDTWCWGLPIVSTSIGAEGIDIRASENILIADTSDDFGAAVSRLLSDGQLNDCLRRNGRQWVEDRYDWLKVYRAWDDVYAGLI